MARRVSQLELMALVKRARRSDHYYDTVANHSTDTEGSNNATEFGEPFVEHQQHVNACDDYSLESEYEDSGSQTNSDRETDDESEETPDEHSEATGWLPNDNKDGWRVNDICALFLYTSKKSGISDSALGKLLKIVALVANVPRHPRDHGEIFPSTVHRLKARLIPNLSPRHETVFICPATSSGRRRREIKKIEERCGYRMRPSTLPTDPTDTYVCDLCQNKMSKSALNKDGNHIVTMPLHSILQTAMKRYGRYTAPLPAAERSIIPDPTLFRDVTDGERFRDMKLKETDLAVLLHSDGAEISKSTSKKMYLTFVQCINIPLHIRLPTWFLHSVWVGEDLPKDRECFLLETSRQLKEIQAGNSGYRPIKWTNSQQKEVSSDGFVLGILADTPEKTAISGQLSHSAAQGCPYCLQVAVCISHRMCYEYMPDIPLKTHEDVLEQAGIWEASNRREREEQLKQKLTKGFKRPSIATSWKNFDMIKGFFLDVMHQLDEGVSRYFLERLMETDGILFHAADWKKMNRTWLAIGVPDYLDREVRSLKFWKKFKAHELRFFLQHAAPYVTKDLVPKGHYKAICLASRIAHTCTKDQISMDDIEILKDLCRQFMVTFQKAFGISEMKFSIHLISHLWYAVKLYGPLHIVSCYGPEDHIGKISRRIQGTNNTAKHIMNSFTDLSEATDYLAEMKLTHEQHDARVMKTIHEIQGLPSTVFATIGPHGRCRMTGRPKTLGGHEIDNRIRQSIGALIGSDVNREQLLRFNRAHTVFGLRVKQSDCLESAARMKRNESVVMDSFLTVFLVRAVVGLVNSNGSEICGMYICGMEMKPPPEIDPRGLLGTKSVPVPHVMCLRVSDNLIVRRPNEVTRQMAILMYNTELDYLLVSPPSNRFRPT